MALAAAVKCKCGQLVSVTKPNVKVRCPICKTILATDDVKTVEPEKPARKNSGRSEALTVQDTTNATGPLPKLDAYETIVSPPHNPPARTSESGDGEREPLPPIGGRSLPDALGPYTIVDEIGRGGMGRVLKGHDGALKRDVAIKILKPDAREDTESRLRFIKEAQISGQLEHPGIPPVHFLGWDEQGNEFFAMKLISGQSLSSVLDLWHKGDEKVRREFPLSRLLSIYERVCEAIGFANSRGVIHRDLKPANVMIGDYGEVWVLDWGLAKVYVQDNASFESAKFEPPKELKAEGEKGLTMHGTIVGTPGYLAPEQALGDPLDDGCDIFGLGALLYEILTNQPPHIGKDLQDTVNRAALGKITPIWRTPKGKHAPAALVAIANKCMALRRKDRYPRVSHLLADLRAYAAGEAVSVKRDSPLAIGARLVRRHKTAAAILVGAIVVLIVVVGALQVQISYNQRIAQEAELEKRTAELKTQTAELERQQESEARLRAELDKKITINAATERATRRMNAFKPYAQANDLLLRGQLAARAVELLREALKIDPEFPEAQFALGQALRSAGTQLDAATAFLKANELNQRILGEPNIQALIAAGWAYDSAGYFHEAMDCLGRAERASPDHPLSLVGKSYRLYMDLQWDAGLKAAEQAATAAPHLWETHLAVGFGLLQLIEVGSVEYYETTEKCHERLKTALDLSPHQAETCVWMGHLLLRGDEKQRRDALQYFSRAVALEPQNGGRYLQRSAVYISFGQLQQAEADHKLGEKYRAAPAQVDLNRVRLLRMQNRNDDANQLMEHVYKRNSDVALITELYALSKVEQRDLAGLPALLERMEKLGGVSATRYWINAVLKKSQNDIAGALGAFEAGLKVVPYNTQLLLLRANHYAAAGKPQEAIADLDKLLLNNPYHSDANDIRLDLLCALNRFDEVRKTLDRLEKAFPSVIPHFKKWRDVLAEKNAGK